MFAVVPWPTATRATTEATPMMTPSIVSAVRSRLVREPGHREPDHVERPHATTRPSRMWTWRGACGGHVGLVRDEDDRAARCGGARGRASMTSAPECAVEVAGGLVGEDERRVGHERAGDGHALLLAAGQLGRLVVEAVAEAQPARARSRARSCALAPARPGTCSGVATFSSARRARQQVVATGRRSRCAGCAARARPSSSRLPTSVPSSR